MALTYNPFGIISSDMTTAAPWSGKINETYQISPSSTDVLLPGDPVTLSGGYIVRYGTTEQGAGAPVLGSFLGCQYEQAGSGYNVPYQGAWLGASANPVSGKPIYAAVEDSPETIFKVATGNASTGVQITATGKNAQFLFNFPAPTINTTTPKSNVGVDGTVGFVTGNATYPLKVIGVFDGPAGAYNQTPVMNGWSTTGPNAVTIAYPVLLVRINNHVFRSGTAGI